MHKNLNNSSSGESPKIMQENAQRAFNDLNRAGQGLRVDMTSYEALELMIEASERADQLGITQESQAEAILGIDQ